MYYDSFPQDRLLIRSMGMICVFASARILTLSLPVYGLLLLEVVQTVTTSHQTWWYMVTNWNNPGALVLFPWSAMTVPTIDGLSEFTVFAWLSIA